MFNTESKIQKLFHWLHSPPQWLSYNPVVFYLKNNAKEEWKNESMLI